MARIVTMVVIWLIVSAGSAHAAPTIITSSTPNHAFGITDVGTSRDVMITLSAAPTGDPVVLDRLRLVTGAAGTTPLGFSVTASTCGADLAASASCSVSVRFAPTGERAYNAELVIGDGPLFPGVFAQMSGTGAVPPTPVEPKPPLVWPPPGLSPPTPVTPTPDPEEDDPTRGTRSADVFNGTQRGDLYRAGSGNDVLRGGAGNDRLHGEVGSDALSGGSGNDVLDGGIGNDRLAGEAGRDLLLGGAGTDALYGGADADRIFGDAGADRIQGDDGNDVVIGGAGRDSINGGAGDDVVNVRDGDSDVVICGAGRDRVIADRFDLVMGCERVERR